VEVLMSYVDGYVILELKRMVVGGFKVAVGG
jgi:hypothetical protein